MLRALHSSCKKPFWRRKNLTGGSKSIYVQENNMWFLSSNATKEKKLWEPEPRYQEFLYHYFSEEDHGEQKIEEAAHKLESNVDEFIDWMNRYKARILLNHSHPHPISKSISSKELEITNSVFELNSIDISNIKKSFIWRSLIMIDKKYVAIILNHNLPFKCKIIGTVDHNWNENIIDKRTIKTFYQYFQPTNDILNLTLQNPKIDVLGNRLPIPLVFDNVITAMGKPVDPFTKPTAPNNFMPHVFFRQTDKSKDSYEPLLTGIKLFDIFNPLVKNGINLFIIPDDNSKNKEFLRNICKHIAQFYNSLLQTDPNKKLHLILSDIFESPMLEGNDIRNSCIDSSIDLSKRLKFTVVAGNNEDDSFYKWQCAVTASALAQSDPKEEVIAMYPNGTMINEHLNYLYQELDGVGLVDFHQSCIFPKYLRDPNSTYATSSHITKEFENVTAAPRFYKYWGIDSSKKNTTYIIGLEMHPLFIDDIRLQPHEYFSWADSVTVFNTPSITAMDISRSVSKLLLESTIDTTYTTICRRAKELYARGQMYSQMIEKKMDKNQMPIYTPSSNFPHVNINKIKDEYELYNKLIQVCNNTEERFQTEEIIAMLQPIISAVKWESKKPLTNTTKGSQEEKTPEKNLTVPFIEGRVVESVLNSLPIKALEKWYILELKTTQQELEASKIPHRVLVFKSDMKHKGFVKGKFCSLSVILYADENLRQQVFINPDHLFIKINQIPIKVSELVRDSNQKNIKEEPTNEQIKQKDLNTKYVDSFEKFGLKFSVFWKRGSRQLLQRFAIRGDCKVDITDITVYLLHFDTQLGKSIAIARRTGSDDPPIIPGNQASRKNIRMTENKLWRDLKKKFRQIDTSNNTYNPSMRRPFIVNQNNIDLPTDSNTRSWYSPVEI